MAQVIIMSKRYQKRPSEILNIDNDLLAYMFDEVSLYLEGQAMDDKSNINWNKIKWKSKTNNDNPKSNKRLMQFIESKS